YKNYNSPFMTYSVELFTYSRIFTSVSCIRSHGNTNDSRSHPAPGLPAMSHAGLFGSWHLARGEAEECYGLGCSRATHRTSTFHTAPERRQTALPCPVTRNRARFPRIALYCVKVLNAANRHSVGETPVQVLKSEKAALFLSRASP